MLWKVCLVLALFAGTVHSLALKGEDVAGLATEAEPQPGAAVVVPELVAANPEQQQGVVGGVENVTEVITTSETSVNLKVDKFGDGLEVVVPEEVNKTEVAEPVSVEPPKPEGENPYAQHEVAVDASKADFDAPAGGILQPMVAPKKPTLLGPAQHHMSHARACSCCHMWAVKTHNVDAQCAVARCTCEDPTGRGGLYCFSDRGTESFREGIEAHACSEEDMLSNACEFA